MLRFTKKLVPEKTAVIVVDMTNAFVDPKGSIYVDMGNKFAPFLNSFLDTCREKGIEIIYTTQEYRKDGSNMTGLVKAEQKESGERLIAGTWEVEIYPVCAPKDGEIIIHKHVYSSFYNTDLDIILRSIDIDTVVITGVCTDVCCFSTARDAMFRGYQVIFLEDLTGTAGHPDCGYGTVSDEQTHIAAINNLYSTTCDVISSEEFLGLLQ